MMTSICPLENMALEGSLLVEKMLRARPTDSGYMDEEDRLGMLEQQASFMQPLSVTGALQQVGLSMQCAERLDDVASTDHEQQALRELKRHLMSLARFMIENGAEPERTYVKALMPSVV